MTKVKRYIKVQIRECMVAGGNLAIDLADRIEKRFGVRYTPQRIGAHLRSMHDAREVTREPVIIEQCLRRYKWFIRSQEISF